MNSRIAKIILSYLKKSEDWSDYVKGEWWIDDSGFAQFADIDVGDSGHEGIAIDNIVGSYVDEIFEAIEEYNKTAEEDDKIDLKHYKQDMEYGGGYLFHEVGIPNEIGEKIMGKDKWTLLNKDPRLAYAKYENAILVIDLNFAAYKITDETIKRIQNFIYEQATSLDEEKLDGEMVIEEYSTGKHNSLNVDDFLNMKHVGELWRHKTAKFEIDIFKLIPKKYHPTYKSGVVFIDGGYSLIEDKWIDKWVLASVHSPKKEIYGMYVAEINQKGNYTKLRNWNYLEEEEQDYLNNFLKDLHKQFIPNVFKFLDKEK